MKIVLQWKCNRWVNTIDSFGKPIYYDSVEEAKEDIPPVHGEYRIAEYLGGRKYKEIEIIKAGA